MKQRLGGSGHGFNLGGREVGMVDQSIEEQIKTALVERLALKLEPRHIADDTPLLGRGLGLDSVAILDLVGVIEKKFDIEIDDNDIGRELFRDVATLGAYVRGKRKAS